MRGLLLAGILVSAVTGIATAQTAAQITGEITDQSGAAAAGASVTATNSATNVERVTTTNTSGIYTFPELAPGNYRVKVTASGFETMVKSNIELQVQQTARI